jgi:hypothetical protein
MAADEDIDHDPHQAGHRHERHSDPERAEQFKTRFSIITV